MKKIYTWLLLSASLICSVALTSCGDNWVPGPAPGYDDFYDPALTGLWELTEINGGYVLPSEVNCLEFNGNGRGWYYYLRGGVPYEEPMSYWCQYSVNNVSDFQVNIRYSGSSPSTMNYWFSHGGNYLYMEWYSYGHGVVTSVYRSVSSLPRPWQAPGTRP